MENERSDDGWEDRPLTPKQQKFTQELILHPGNATDAAARAGYKGDRHTLSAVASQNLRKPAIRQRLDSILEDGDISAARVLQEVRDIAYAPFTQFLTLKYNRNGDVIDAKLDPGVKLKALEVLIGLLGLKDPENDADREEVVRALIYINPSSHP